MYVIGERGSVDYLNTATGGRWRGLCASPCPLVAHGIHDSVDDSLEGGFLVPCQEGGDLWVWGWWGVTGCMYEGEGRVGYICSPGVRMSGVVLGEWGSIT